MLSKFLSIGLLVSCAFSANLKVSDGFVKAHTEVFGDSTIEPVSKVIDSKLTIDDAIESIKGKIYISLVDLKSDNAKRDENMFETLDISKYKNTNFEIKSVQKEGNLFLLKGVMDLHGVQKELVFKSDVKYVDNKLILDGNGSFDMSGFGINPPKLLFLTVRDRVDIAFKLNLVKE